MHDGMMAAGTAGVVTALLVYSLFFNLLCPVDFNLFAEHSANYNAQSKKLVNIADRLIKQIHNISGNFGLGKHIVAVTFIFPFLHNRVKSQTKSSTRLYQNEALGLIIMICLLLSGDVHPCPGPHYAKPENFSDFISNPISSQWHAEGPRALQCGYVPGFGVIWRWVWRWWRPGGWALPAWIDVMDIPAIWSPCWIQLSYRYALWVAVRYNLATLITLTCVVLSRWMLVGGVSRSGRRGRR